MGLYRRGKFWWYEFVFAGKRVRESVKTTSKTVAKLAEQKRRRELEEGFNGLKDTRDERIKTIKELVAAYLEDYKLRHKSVTFAEYAVGNLKRHLGELMAVDVTDKTVKAYQTARLKEKAAPKTINEEVGFLLRLMGEIGEPIRARLRRQRALKLPVRHQIGKAYTPEEKSRLLGAARAARSPAIYPALMLALNAGIRDAEIRGLQWGRVDLSKTLLTVGESKTEAGEGRTIPLNSALLEAMVDYSKWYTGRFGTIQPDWYVFAFGKPRPKDPTKPMVTLKTAWTNVRKKAAVSGRWHDNRHTLITDLAESGAADETIRDIAGHVSRQMLKHYSHIRMEAKRRALEAIVTKKADRKPTEGKAAVPTEVPTLEAGAMADSGGVPTKVPTVERAT
ncbi:MAG: site-specific integrase [Acidobacteriota bacterium]